MIKRPVILFPILWFAVLWTRTLSLTPIIRLHPPMKDVVVPENNSHAVTCESPNAINIKWYRHRKDGPGKPYEVSSKRNTDLFVELSPGQSQLIFPQVTSQHQGRYLCTVDDKESVEFSLKVYQHLKLKQGKDVYYVPLGDNITLECGTDDSTQVNVVWKINDQHLQGKHYMTLKSGLFVMNVTENQVGNYTCTAVLITETLSDTTSIKMALKIAKKPEIIARYIDNVAHVLPNTTARIRCEVLAEPSARMQWFRNNQELNLRKSNATIENKDNESILKIFYSRPEFLGNYTCKAENQFGEDERTFNLVEGIQPEIPTLNLRQPTDQSCSFDIYPSPIKHNVTIVEIWYRKQDSNDTEWKIQKIITAVPQKDDSYTLTNLEANTKYVIKIGACTDPDICEYSKEQSFETAKTTTGFANSVERDILIQLLTLLPAFIVCYYSH